MFALLNLVFLCFIYNTFCCFRFPQLFHGTVSKKPLGIVLFVWFSHLSLYWCYFPHWCIHRRFGSINGLLSFCVLFVRVSLVIIIHYFLLTYAKYDYGIERGLDKFNCVNLFIKTKILSTCSPDLTWLLLASPLRINFRLYIWVFHFCDLHSNLNF